VFFPHLILTSPPTISSAASLFFLLLFSVTGPISRDASRVLAPQRASHLPIAPGASCDAYSARSLQPRGASDVTEPATPPLALRSSVLPRSFPPACGSKKSKAKENRKNQKNQKQKKRKKQGKRDDRFGNSCYKPSRARSVPCLLATFFSRFPILFLLRTCHQQRL
jgi:hypothetical protein